MSKAMKFYLLVLLYIFVLFGSIYGFFVSELNIGFGADSAFNLSLSGWGKNLVCLFGLLLIGVVSTWPIVSAVYKAIKGAGQ